MMNFLSLLMALILAILSMFGVSGCITVKDATGTSTTRMDVDSTILLLQASLPLAQAAFDAWTAQKNTMDAAVFEQGQVKRQQNIDLIQSTITQLLAKQAAKAAASVK